MRETAKNYEDRINKGDFINYLHGGGIDIGGGMDCLKLPPNVKGSVQLWDLNNGDAQYLHKLKDESFDFVYASHCLEHMRDLKIAFINWLRVCKVGGYVYICVPHETYYEKGQWPSINNPDHKWSFTVNDRSEMPRNIVIKDFLADFSRWIEIIEIRENLKNYNFSCDKKIDQTCLYENNVCAQIDFVIQKKKSINLTKQWKRKNNILWLKDLLFIMFPIYFKMGYRKIIPLSIKKFLKNVFEYI